MIVLVVGDIETKLPFLKTHLDQGGNGRESFLGGLIDKCDVIFESVLLSLWAWQRLVADGIYHDVHPPFARIPCRAIPYSI
jgi:hypothetical protein